MASDHSKTFTSVMLAPAVALPGASAATVARPQTVADDNGAVQLR